MTYVHREIIDHPSAWTNASIGGKEGLMHRIEPAELDAFDELLVATADIAPLETTREQFAHPALLPMYKTLRELLLNGRGTVVVSGMTRERYTEEQLERLYWGIGLHLGIPASQSYRGDRLGRVTQTAVGAENPVDRGYKGSGELMPHTDNNVGIVGLLCVQKAAEGGYSLVSSSAAIHNVLLATRPELLERLYEGYYMTSQEATLSAHPHNNLKIPVFSHEQGHLSCLFNRGFYERANSVRHDMSEAFDEATNLVVEIARRPDIEARFILEPGEILFINNYTALHARTNFADSPEYKRCLLRLWLLTPDGRPLCEAYRLKKAGYAPGTQAKATATA